MVHLASDQEELAQYWFEARSGQATALELLVWPHFVWLLHPARLPPSTAPNKHHISAGPGKTIDNSKFQKRQGRWGGIRFARIL